MAKPPASGIQNYQARLYLFPQECLVFCDRLKLTLHKLSHLGRLWRSCRCWSCSEQQNKSAVQSATYLLSVLHACTANISSNDHHPITMAGSLTVPSGEKRLPDQV